MALDADVMCVYTCVWPPLNPPNIIGIYMIYMRVSSNGNHANPYATSTRTSTRRDVRVGTGDCPLL